MIKRIVFLVLFIFALNEAQSQCTTEYFGFYGVSPANTPNASIFTGVTGVTASAMTGGSGITLNNLTENGSAGSASVFRMGSLTNNTSFATAVTNNKYMYTTIAVPANYNKLRLGRIRMKNIGGTSTGRGASIWGVQIYDVDANTSTTVFQDVAIADAATSDLTSITAFDMLPGKSYQVRIFVYGLSGGANTNTRSFDNPVLYFNALPVLSSTTATICPGTTFNLNTLVTNSAVSTPNVDLRWYSDAALTVPVPTPSTANAGTYYATYKDKTSDCNNPSVGPITVSVSNSGCTDTDGDGIPDSIDLDDDNDGILDTVEGANTSVTMGEVTNGTSLSDLRNTNSALFPLVPPGATLPNGGVRITKTAGTGNGWGYYGSGTATVTVDGVTSPAFSSTYLDMTGTLARTMTVDFGKSAQDLSTSANSYQYIIGIAGLGGEGPTLTETFSVPLTVVGNADMFNTGFYSLLDGKISTSPGATGTVVSTNTPTSIFAQGYTFYFIPKSAASFTMTIAGGNDPHGFIFGVYQSSKLDTDGDGVPNYLDTDSDGDGCYDAIEGDENVLPSQLNANGSINITTTGGVDINGVPKLVNSGGSADLGGDQGQGIETSQNASVKETATITTQPLASQAVNHTAASTNLTVAASGSPSLTYQWYSNTSNSNTGGTAISGAITNTYTPSTTTVGTQYYYVEVTGSCGSAKSGVSTVIVQPRTNLSVTKSANPSNPLVGTNVTFTITATNAGPSAATGVKVSDVLSTTGYTYVSSTATTGSYDNATGEWTIGSLAKDGTATLTIVATVKP